MLADKLQKELIDMGRSAEATIFYGYVWRAGDWKEPWDHRFNQDVFVEELLKGQGYSNPWDSLDEGKLRAEIPDYTKRRLAEDVWVAEHRHQIDKWRSLKEKKAKDSGFDRVLVGSHGHGDCPSTLIAVKASMVSICWGEHVPLGEFSLSVAQGWEEDLDKVIRIIDPDLTDAAGPGYFMVVYYG